MKKKRKIENKCWLQNCWQKGKNSLFLLNVCPGVGRALPAAASEPSGRGAVWVAAGGAGVKFVLGRLVPGMSGTRAWARSAENKWAQVRSQSRPVEGPPFP